MGLFNRAEAIVGMFADDAPAIHAYHGEMLVWDGTRQAFVSVTRTTTATLARVPVVSAGSTVDSVPAVDAAVVVFDPVLTATAIVDPDSIALAVLVTDPAVSADSLILVDVITGSAQVLPAEAGESNDWNTSAVPAIVDVDVLVPDVASNLTRQPPAVTVTVLAPVPVVTATGSGAVIAVVAVVSALAATPALSAAGRVTALVATASASANTPVIGGGATITAVTATGTAAVTAPPYVGVAIKSMKAVLNATVTKANSATPSQLVTMVADTTAYPDSVVSSSAIVIDGAGTVTFTVQARLYQTNSGTATAHLRKNGVQIGPTYQNASGGTGAGAAVTDAFGGTFTATVANGDLITMWVATQASTSNRREFDLPADNWFRVTP
ncbi:hypothetical protein [Rhodococcus jostii]|uniref:hypothetical protein n=1 Tax=Rhodococcus jostii TaxID=132919 RepID=UPI0036258AF9